MAWTILDIEKHWLNSPVDVLNLDPQEILAAFEMAERLLGAGWMSRKNLAKGILPAMDVIRMGQLLTAIEGARESEAFLKELSQGNESTQGELVAAYLLKSCSNSVELELYPVAGTRKPDLRVRRDGGEWTFVEVARPDNSLEEKHLRKVLDRLIRPLADVNHQFTVQIGLSREPSELEIKALIGCLPEFCALEGKQQARLNDDLGFLLLNHDDAGHVFRYRVEGQPEVPEIAVAAIVAGPSGGPHRQIAVSIPFSDQRAKEFLRREAKQLSKDSSGLLMMDMTSAPGGFENWESVLRSQFKPDSRTRVSGVCLFGDQMLPVAGRYSCFVRTKVITNPHARFSLPSWIVDGLERIGKEFKDTWNKIP